MIKWKCIALFLLFVSVEDVGAQHTKHEIGLSLACGGQIPLVSSGNNSPEFFRKPLIWEIRYQASTDFVQAISIVAQHVTELRNRKALWNDVPNALSGAYDAEINERLSITTLGIEGNRTIVRAGDFRLGVGVGLGYGFGGATANVRRLPGSDVQTVTSCDTWNGFLISSLLRARYSLYISDGLDIGLTGTARIWGFPSISPLTDCQSSYNGPTLRSVIEAGYLIGISVGFK
ncbi:MAG: hypothetical protein WCH46_07675 [bacterium]